MLRAEGDAKALLTIQEAQAQTVRMLMAAVNESGAPAEALQLQYMQMLPKLAANPANKIFVIPADIAGLAGLATSVAPVPRGDQIAPAQPAATALPNTSGDDATRP
jgi:regulator of protease activity HflC (stomatin/prohibitin superfamily)